MIKTTEDGKKAARIRWGDRLVCSIKNGQGVCKYNDTVIKVEGKNNKDIIDKLFKELCKI